MRKVKIGVIETSFSFVSPQLLNPAGMEKSEELQHGDYVVRVIEQNIDQLKAKYPNYECEIYALPYGPLALSWAVKLDLDIVNLSMTHSGVMSDAWKSYSEEYDIFLCAAAGNDGENKEEYAASRDWWLAVGALGLDGKRTSYSSYGLGSVFCMKQGDYDFDNDGIADIRGTSFACPDLVAEVSFYLWHYKNKYGKKSPINVTGNFIKDNCRDIELQGKDLYTGWGVFELPELNTKEYPEDIKGHWAEELLKEYIDLGVIKGYPDGTIKPDRQPTLAEIITILDRIKKL
jgi:hypothetical protein